MTATDDRILEVLTSDTRATSKVLSEDSLIHASGPTVNQRLKELSASELIETGGQGIYRITDAGRLYLCGGYAVGGSERQLQSGFGEREFDQFRAELQQLVEKYR